MNAIFKMAIALLVWFVLFAVQVHADEVHLTRGDKLIGKIQNAHLAVQTPYAQVVVKNEFLKALSITDSRSGRGALRTINNDLFSGNLLNEEIHILLENNARSAHESRNGVQRNTSANACCRHSSAAGPCLPSTTTLTRTSLVLISLTLISFRASASNMRIATPV